MNILYWTPLFWPDLGGTQTLAMNAIPVLAERGYEVTVVTSHGFMEQPDLTEYKGIPVHRFPFLNALTKNDIPLIMKINRQVIELIGIFKPDLIHVDFSGYTAYFLHATTRYQPFPILISLHGDLTGLNAGQDTITNHLFQKADWVTAVSNAILTRARQLIPEIAERSSMVYGCPGPSNLAPAPLIFEKPCIAGIGRLVHEKGFDLLLDAIPAILERFPTLIVQMIGDGNERIALEQRAISLGIKERVEFIGSIPTEDIPTYINKATLVVIPSRWYEAFGIVAVEAALMARPVVATNTGGLAEIVIDDVTGLLVDKENPQALADAIIKLLSQPEKAQQMGQAARSRAQQKFNLMNYVNAYDNLYQKLYIKQSLRNGLPK